MSNNQNEIVHCIENCNHNLLKELLAKDGAIRKRDSKGRPLLLLAAEIGDCKTGEILLSFGADINATSVQQITALQIAFAQKNYDFVLFLIQNGARIGTKDQQGRTILHHIAADGLNEIAQQIFFNTIYLPTPDRNRKFTVDLAIENGHNETGYLFYKAIMRTFPHPESVSKSQKEILLWFFDAFSYLLDRLSQDPDILNWNGRGFHLLELCLIYLPRNEYRFDLLQRLVKVVDISYDPNIEVQKENDEIVFVSESYNSLLANLINTKRGPHGGLEARDVKLLVEQLSELDNTNLLKIAFSKENYSLQNYLLTKDTQKTLSETQKVQLFLSTSGFSAHIWDKMEMNLSYQDEQGNNLLHLNLKSYHRSENKTQWLIENGIDPDQVDPEGDSALHIALKNNFYLEIRKLIAMGADPNTKDRRGLDCWAYSGSHFNFLEDYSFRMPPANLKELGPKKLGWLMSHAESFKAFATDNPSKAIFEWLNDFIFQVYRPKMISQEAMWGMFLASLVAMRQYLQGDEQLPDRYEKQQSESIEDLQKAIITYGLRMGKWVAMRQAQAEASANASKWTFCQWQDSLRDLFFIWANPEIEFSCSSKDFLPDLIDCNDISPKRHLLMDDRKEWLEQRIAKFNSENSNIMRGVSLLNDFVIRMRIEDSIPDEKELLELIFRLFKALENEKIVKPEDIDNEDWCADPFVGLYFELLKIVEQVAKFEPCEFVRNADQTGYYKGEETLRVINGWAYILGNSATP